jgi:hypothetical protein
VEEEVFAKKKTKARKKPTEAAATAAPAKGNMTDENPLNRVLIEFCCGKDSKLLAFSFFALFSLA